MLFYLHILYQINSKYCVGLNSTLYYGVIFAGERLEFPGQGEGNLEDLVELEIKRKRERYQSNLQPFYQQCIKNEVGSFLCVNNEKSISLLLMHSFRLMTWHACWVTDRVLQVWIGLHNRKDNRIKERLGWVGKATPMPKSVFAVERIRRQQKHKECKSCVAQMCGGDLYYIGMEW